MSRFIVGSAVFLGAIALAWLGREEYFGYLDEHYVLVSFLGLIGIVVGPWLWAIELRRLMDQSKNLPKQ